MTAVADTSKEKTGRRGGWRKWLVAAAAAALAGFLLWRTFGQTPPAEIAAQIRDMPGASLAGAAGFAALSYLCLGLFDYLGLRYAGRPMPYRRAALASFTALSLGHTIGFAALSSGAVRYRFYSRWGLGAEDIAKVILFCGVTVGLGLAALGSAALLWRPDIAVRLGGFSPAAATALGVGAASACAAYVAACALVRRPLRIRSWRFALPSPRLAMAQVGVGALNFAMVAGCLHQALAAVADIGYAEVAAAYVIANCAALLSHVPGGLGVIEAVVAALIPGTVVGALVVFRLAYFVTPFLLGMVVFALSELVLKPSSSRGKAG
jgi:uncharacterized membrane protein YbhN (UPF0104 family)